MKIDIVGIGEAGYELDALGLCGYGTGLPAYPSHPRIVTPTVSAAAEMISILYGFQQGQFLQGGQRRPPAGDAAGI